MMLPSAEAGEARPRQTILNSLHRELGARMVPFAGYEMPVQYPGGIKSEHLHTRSRASLFDVSHMGQVRIRGRQRAVALEALVPADIIGLGAWRQRYTVLTSENGGILDDLMVTALPEALHLVVNAARLQADLRQLNSIPGGKVEIEPVSDRALLALQGPESEAVLSRLATGVEKLRFLEAGEFEINGGTCLVSRSGYTGEDGFEISVAAEKAEALARRLLAEPAISPAGLGARDSLRLEAGLCLYGQDIDESTSPVEAGLSWTIGKARREGPRAVFPGAARILRELREGAPRCRVGLRPEGPAPVRAGTRLRTAEGEAIGSVTSGGYAPSLEAPVAMGYVPGEYVEPGTKLFVEIRGRKHALKVSRLPFITPRYRR